MPSILASSAIIVGLLGYFLYQGVSIRWADQFALASSVFQSIAGGGRVGGSENHLAKMGRTRWIWVTLLPMVC